MDPISDEILKRIAGLVGMAVGYFYLLTLYSSKRRRIREPNLFGVDDVKTSQASPNVGSLSSTARTKKSRSKRIQNFAAEEVSLGITKGLAEVTKAVSGQDQVNELYAAVMEMKEEFPKELLERALVYLVKNRSKGQVFIARSHASRAKWLQSFSK